MGRRTIKRGSGRQMIEGKGFRLADEIGYTDSGDAWLLDVTDHLAARLARDGDPEPIHLEETDTSFAIEWQGHNRIAAPAFVYSDRDTGRVTAILGTQRISSLKRADLKISNMFG